jgi:hypothetical protein
MGNQLTGSVPSELCRLVLDRGAGVIVDCWEVACDCGCTCVDSFGDDALSGDVTGDGQGAAVGTSDDIAGDDATR